jgi:hypothetical protein
MSEKIIFNWSLFSDIELQLSEVEKIVIKEHFNIWVEGNSNFGDCSAPEMQEKFSIFKAGWIMSQMFTN